MAIAADEHGRLPLPESVLKRYGEQFQIVTPDNRVVLVPVADDPLSAVQESAGELRTSSIDEIRADIDRTAPSRSNHEDRDKW